jgi:recombination protein RecT
MSVNNQSVVVQNQKQQSVKGLLENVNYKKRFEEILGKKAAGFMSSLINLTNSDVNLSKCDPKSVVASAVVAATLDLPIDKNLGFAWILPYNSKNGPAKAQFQLGYKGFVQLALRTGQYKNINVIEVREGQIKSFNPLTEELEFDFEENESAKIIGYAAYFKLVNGFEKTVYWPIEKVVSHGKRFSKSFNNGPWKSDFDEMAKKTVLKNTLSRWGILSIEMQTAFKTDQAAINDFKNHENPNVEYVDNPDYVVNDAVEIKDAEETTSQDQQTEDAKNIFEGSVFEEE